MVVRIATRSPKGSPQIMPLWFGTHRGRICMNTAETSPTVRNIATNPEVVLLFDGGQRRAATVLRIRGTAQFRRDRGFRALMGLKVWSRYYLSPAALIKVARNLRRLPAMATYYQERGAHAGVIEVIPESFELVRSP